ncbi:hypothetical protein SAMN05216323_100832 [Williamwhitmania taraxaci]|uniref:Uncharacterized protein n=1 Tax=Williamwhitmania taraxaci TaxID=1640674 RepID=A0A1G6H8Y2_9BACT|nr:hypothetical protein SAMN05216323_100832 [Williamwhitmania taraxaci]
MQKAAAGLSIQRLLKFLVTNDLWRITIQIIVNYPFFTAMQITFSTMPSLLVTGE